LAAVGALALAALSVACERSAEAHTRRQSYVSPPLPSATGVAALPEGPYVGLAVSAIEADARNPFTNEAAAVRRGEELFVGMNCAGCHGWEAKTGIFAPGLTDSYWRYGGSDADVFSSIYRGRARGMPAWGGVLTKDQIWQIVAYIHSLGGMQEARLPGPPTPAHDTLGAAGPTPHNKRMP
jgi:cytochrome c oxidase cbb3-type subunit 3